jgi:hypothetical protein
MFVFGRLGVRELGLLRTVGFVLPRKKSNYIRVVLYTDLNRVLTLRGLRAKLALRCLATLALVMHGWILHGGSLV